MRCLSLSLTQTAVCPSPCVDLQRGLQDLRSLLGSAGQLLRAQEVTSGAHLQHGDHGRVGVQARGQLQGTRVTRRKPPVERGSGATVTAAVVLTLTLVTRGPSVFFIQDVRSSACSCDRRSEAADRGGQSELETWEVTKYCAILCPLKKLFFLLLDKRS